MTAGDMPGGDDAIPGAVGRASAVRPFLVTAGRVAGTGTGPPIPVETQVVTTAAGTEELDLLSFERRDIVALCRHPQSLAEVAARLRLHLNVVRVLVEDLRSGGQLSVHLPDAGAARDVAVLRRVIEGLRTVPDTRPDPVVPAPVVPAPVVPDARSQDAP